ncbi:MAG: hybrid sensor histidine kinase/response regulator [Acidobacteriota bacterium]
MGALILIADDDETSQELFADILHTSGYATLKACDGNRVVEMARWARPDLILMDLAMPGMDGYAAAKILKQDPQTSAIPIVAVTAFAMVGDRQRVTHAGFDGYLDKPIRVKELRAVVGYHLGALALPDLVAPRQGKGPATDLPDFPVPWSSDSVGKVLVVDDDRINRELFTDILEADGHTVIVAEDGMQALATALHECPDAALVDVMMPGIDGFDVCRLLRRDERTRHLPILIVTALRDRAALLTGIRAGANDFLNKPVDAEELRLRVRNAVLAKHQYDSIREDGRRIEALQLLQDKLTGLIVHDMRSPLLAVSASFELLLAGDVQLNQEQRELQAMGQQSCEELVRMVSSLLDVSRMEAGEMPLARDRWDIVAVATSAAESVAALARLMELNIDVGGEPTTVEVDRDLMHRVLVNLLGNAIKHSPRHAAIDVRIAATPTTARVTVTDRGPGIPPEYHQRIFEKFGQVESRASGAKHSTGLGLTFCKLAVEAHGGQIGVESQVGLGSAFWIDLPLSGAQEQPVDRCSGDHSTAASPGSAGQGSKEGPIAV